MRKMIFSMLLAVMAVANVCADNIAVVSDSGTTTIYRTLDEAINSATDGCVIYLPGGGIPISDSTKVTKKVTIIGVTHRIDTDNVDGATRIGGSINFEAGSDGSALMGVYVNGDVNIGTANDSVQNILIRYCNVNSVQVKRTDCNGIVVNQSFLRENSKFGNNNVEISNCVTSELWDIDSGTINHNILLTTTSGSAWHYLAQIINTLISNSIFIPRNNLSYDLFHSGYAKINNIVTHNIYGDPRTIDKGSFAHFLSKSKACVDISFGISPQSDFHLADSVGIGAATDGTDIGIYGGTGFKDNCIAPIPRIVTKDIPEQTDAEGKLNIRIEAKFD